MHPNSPFVPFSPQAAAITQLFNVTLWVLAFILLVVVGSLSYIVLRFRHRGEEGEPPQIDGHHGLEVTWTVIPCLIIIGLFVGSWRVMLASDPPDPGTQTTPDVIITGHQWWWEIQYTDGNVITANELHLPVGKRLLARIESADVIHDFWVQALGPKKDAVPGHPNYLWLEADEPGLYDGTCAEYCGNQHAWMRIRAVADAPADFDKWKQTQLQPLDANSEGARLTQTQTCISCHRVAGWSDTRVGPDLTHLETRQTLGAGVLDNTPENLGKWLEDPQAIKPGCLMPDFHLSDRQINALTQFLEHRGHS
jgi:cytochrome c oxidase subunit 2